MGVIHQRIASVAIVCGFTLVGYGTMAQAGPGQEDIVRPNLDRITLCEEGIREVGRQGGLALDELGAWKAWRESLQAEMARNSALLDQQQDYEKTLADRYVSSAQSLTPLEGESAYIPHFGWGVFGIVEQHRDEVNAAIADVDSKVGDGSVSFYVVGQGWTTGEGLEAAIQADADRIAALEASLSDGSFAIHYPGLGWVSRTDLEACITSQQNEIDATYAQISAGEYTMNLPNLGWVTRNSLSARIDAAEAELAALRTQKTDGDMTINRTNGGWFTQNELTSRMEAEAAALSDFQATVSEGNFSHNIPEGGWLTANDLKQKIEAERAGIAEVQASASAGEYSVPMNSGWANRNEALAALALPDCYPEGPSPCLNPASRPHYENAVQRIPTAVQVDIAVRQEGIDKLEKWLGAIAQDATPQIDKYKVALELYAVRQAEFDIELANAEARMQRHIDWLRQNLEYLP